MYKQGETFLMGIDYVQTSILTVNFANYRSLNRYLSRVTYTVNCTITIAQFIRWTLTFLFHTTN